jgi:hypothetical protein
VRFSLRSYVGAPHPQALPVELRGNCSEWRQSVPRLDLEATTALYSVRVSERRPKSPVVGPSRS